MPKCDEYARIMSGPDPMISTRSGDVKEKLDAEREYYKENVDGYGLTLEERKERYPYYSEKFLKRNKPNICADCKNSKIGYGKTGKYDTTYHYCLKMANHKGCLYEKREISIIAPSDPITREESGWSIPIYPRG